MKDGKPRAGRRGEVWLGPSRGLMPGEEREGELGAWPFLSQGWSRWVHEGASQNPEACGYQAGRS